MSKSIALELGEREASSFESALDKTLEALRSMDNEESRERDERIVRLRAETHILMEQIRKELHVEKLYELLERIVTLSQRVSRQEKQHEELRQEVRELTSMIHRLAIEVNRLADRHTSERENTALWVENQMLKFERRLVLPRSGIADDDSSDKE